MTTRSVARVMWLLLLSGCGSDCGCSSGEAGSAGGESATKGPRAPRAPLPPPPPQAGSEEALLASAPARLENDPDFVPPDAGVDATVAPGQFGRLKDAQLGRYQALQKKLTENPVAAKKLIDAAKLEAVLVDTLGDFTPRGPAVGGPSELGGAPVVVRAREYLSGKTHLYVKLTDTGQAPQLREEYIRSLTIHGDAFTGGQRPVQSGDDVLIEAVHPTKFSNSVVALMGGRFLVEIRTRTTGDRLASRRIFEALALSPLRK